MLNEGGLNENAGKLTGREMGYHYWDYATSTWWFFLFFGAVFMWIQFAPVSEPLENIIMILPNLSPWFLKIVALAMIVCVIVFQNRIRTVFNIFAAITFFVIAFLDNVSDYFMTNVLINNLIVIYLLVAAVWFAEAAAGKNDFTMRLQPAWKYWVILPALFAFYPVNVPSMLYGYQHNFFGYFPVIMPATLALLTLCHPRINILTLRITSLAGVVIGYYSMQLGVPAMLRSWPVMALFIPLLSLSIYGLVLSFEKVRS